MHIVRRSAALTLATAFLVAGCATGSDQVADDDGDAEEEEQEIRTQQRTTEFAGWDEDDDAALDRFEFDSWWADDGLAEEWDEDSDGEIHEEEFTGGLFDHWDVDDDDAITEREWEERVVVWFADTDYGTWSDWDLDADSTLDVEEVRENLGREGLYDIVDLDDDFVLDGEEIADWVFDIFDTNDDGQIDIAEWVHLGT